MPDPTLNYTRSSPSERRAALARAVRRWSLRISRTLLILAILAFIIDQTWVWYWRRIQIGHDTTRITSPIEPSGCPDYLAALNTQYSAGITPENNAAPLLLQIVGTNDSPPTWRSAIHKLLALGPTPLPPQFVTLAESKHVASGSTTKPTLAEQSAEDDEEAAATSAPWNPADHPQWAAWINANQQALDLLQTATARPKYYIPTVSKTGATAHLGDEALVDTQIVDQRPYRELASASLARAMMRLNADDIDGFRHDLTTTAALARLLVQGPSLFEYLPARWIDERTSIALETAATSQHLNPWQVDFTFREFAALPPLPPPTQQLDQWERYVGLDIICKFARFGTLDGENVSGSRYVPVNINCSLRFVSSHHDAMVSLFADPVYARRTKAFAHLYAVEDPIFEHGRAIERDVLNFSYSDLRGLNKLWTTGSAHRNLALTALALRAHKLRTGAFPTSLAALAPPPATTQNSGLRTQNSGLQPRDFTKDPFTDQPLVYRRQGNGYLLYSLGPNQKDDAGTPRATDGPARTNYDIPVHAAK